MKERHQSLELQESFKYKKKKSRLDLEIIKNLNISSEKEEDLSDTDTLVNLDDECFDSIYSSPRFRKEREFLAYDRVMPFDFQTHRKAKQFFKDEILEIDDILFDKSKI